MDNLSNENEELQKRIDILLDENKKLKIKYENIINKYKYKVLTELKIENDNLHKKLEEKYDNCMIEKQALKDEIKELLDLLDCTRESKRKKTESVNCC
jgi:predicted RNase H-like nuclease (RuvC/YqgF family)